MRLLRRLLTNWLVLIALLAAISLLAWSLWRHRTTEVFHTGQIPAGYGDEAGCRACHQNVAKDLAKSAMGQAWRSWTDALPVEPRTSPSEPRGTDEQLFYQAVFQSGRPFQRVFRTDADGQEHDLIVREAKYVLGSGAQSRAYVSSDTGYLDLLPLAWYPTQERWDLIPGFDKSNPRFSGTLSAQCMSCHNSMVAYLPGSGHAYVEPLPNGLGCQRCHGPGAEHAALRKGPVVPEDLKIVNPADLPPDRQQDICLQCHLVGSPAIPQPGMDHWSFRPGMRLRDVRSDFIDEAQGGEVIPAVGHGPRSMASACYVQSDGRMTCTYCHDPHKPVAAFQHDFYARRCLECHEHRPCTRALAANESATTGDCVACHMPKRDVGTVPHVAVTEHWIRRRSDERAPKAVPSLQGDLRAFWPDTSDGQVGAAYIDYYGPLGRRDDVQKGIVLLEQALARRPSHPGDWELRLGVGYSYLEQWERACQAYQRALRDNPNLVEASAGLGEALLRMGKTSQGLKRLEHTLARWPWYYRSDLSMVRSYWEAGMPERIVEMEEKYFQHHPAEPQRLEFVALAVERLGRPFEQAKAALERTHEKQR